MRKMINTFLLNLGTIAAPRSSKVPFTPHDRLSAPNLTSTYATTPKIKKNKKTFQIRIEAYIFFLIFSF